MPNRLTARSALAMSLSILMYPMMCVAASGTFTGALMSESFDRPIPIVVEFRDSGGKLIGNVETSSPLTSAPVPPGTQRILGDKVRDECDISSDIGNDLKLNMAGICTSTTFEGRFQLYLRDQQIREGKFALKRKTSAKDDNKKKLMTESERHSMASATNTMCLRANGTCLAACSRPGDSSSEFLCANNCRHKLLACRAKGKKKLDLPTAEPVE